MRFLLPLGLMGLTVAFVLAAVVPMLPALLWVWVRPNAAADGKLFMALVGFAVGCTEWSADFGGRGPRMSIAGFSTAEPMSLAK